jgi:hypothetical protein
MSYRLEVSPAARADIETAAICYDKQEPDLGG